MNVKEKVRKFLSNFIGKNEITDEDLIFEKRLVNSLFALQLVSFIEKEFSITLSNEELDIENFKNVNSIVALIESKC